MVVREDIWANETCLVCQSKHNSEAERKSHEDDVNHNKKVTIFDFFANELQIRAPSTTDSILYERYSRANVTIAGLDCICELKFSWTKTPLWVCTVCYVSGASLNSVDSHVYSSQHKRNYINIHHPDKYDELITKLEKCLPEDYAVIEYETVQQLLYDAKCLSPPDVYIFEDCHRQRAYNILGLEDKDAEVNFAEYLVEPISDFHQIVQCMTCGQSFFAYEKPSQLQQSWHTHLSSNHHQRCRLMLSILEEKNLEQKDGLPSYCYNKTEMVFNEFSKVTYGPTCGFEFMVDFLDGKECFCTICFCIILKHEATEHFSSEYHIECFTRRLNPSKLLSDEYMKQEERHEILIEIVSKDNKSKTHRFFKDAFPNLLKRFAFVEGRIFKTLNVEEINVGTNKVVWCQECSQYIKIVDKDSWQNHLMEESHFDFCTKRAMYYLDEENLVSSCVSLPAFRKMSKGWEEKFSATLGCTITTQDHCYYGLKYIVRDELSRVSICICCHFFTNYEEDDIMSMHIRSLDHLMRIMHLTNKKFLDILWKNERAVEKQKACLLDYLKHCKLDTVVDVPIVYDPVSALNANCYGRVSRWLLDLSKLPPEIREMSLGSLKLEDFAKNNIPFNVAMRSAKVEIRHIESAIVLFCQECNQAFSCTMENIKERFAEHIFSVTHWTRQQSLRENRLDENKRVLGQTSSFIVNPFFQASQKKKVTWKWNETRRTFEFVYAQLGLSNIIERRNFKMKRDLYCTLCAESIKATKYELEHHIRSFAHIFYYVHNHRSYAIPELETILIEKDDDVSAKHKNIRRLLAKTLKDLEKEKGEVSIYDMSIKFCELAEVKNVIDFEGQNEIQLMQLIKNGPRRDSTDRSALTAIYARDFDVKDPAEIQQFIVSLTRKGGKSNSDLDAIQCKILTASVNEERPTAAKDLPLSVPLTLRDSTHPSSASATNSNQVNATDGGVTNRAKSSVSAAESTNDETNVTNNTQLTTSTTTSRTLEEDGRSLGSRSPPLKSPSPELRHSESHPLAKSSLNRFNTIISRIYPPEARTEINASNNQRSTELRSNSPLRANSVTGSSKRLSISPVRNTSRRRSRSRSSRIWHNHHSHRSSRSPTFRSSRHRGDSSRSSRSPSSSLHSRHQSSRLKDGDQSKRLPSRDTTNTAVHRSGSSHNTNTKETKEKLADLSTKKIQINLLKKSETKEASLQQNYRIRNAPTGNVNYKNIDPVVPHAEDRDEKKNLSGGYLASLNKSTNSLNNPNFSKMLDSAHIKTVGDFLSKTARNTSTMPLGGSGTSTFGTNLFASGGIPVPGTFGHPSSQVLPSCMTGFMPPFTNIPPPSFGLQGFPQPMPSMPFVPIASQTAGAPPKDHNEIIMHAKMELFQCDLVKLKNVPELIDYMWNHGYDKIPDSEKPLLFNDVVKKRHSVLGCSLLYQILCYEHPELETFYCGMCNFWTTVSEIFAHLCAPMHRLNYMFRNYKVYHRRALEEQNEFKRNQLLEKMAEQVWKLEGSGECTNRMRCILNEAVIFRLWPDVHNYIDHSWKIADMDLSLTSTSTEHKRSSTAQNGEAKIEVEGDSAINDLLLQYRAELAAHSRNGQLSAQIDAIKKMKEDREKSKHSSRSESNKDKKSSSRSSPSSRKRKDSSKSRSPHRRRDSHLRSPASKLSRRHCRSPSSDARRRGRRSRSRSRSLHGRTKTDDRKDCLDKACNLTSSSTISSVMPKKKMESWDEKAAAFLDRIGNRREAARIYLSTFDERTNSSKEEEGELSAPATESSSSTLGFFSNTGLVKSSVNSGNRNGGVEKSVEDRLHDALLRGKAVSGAGRTNVTEEIAAELSRLESGKELRIPASSKDHQLQKNRFESAIHCSTKGMSEVDEKAEMRKTIGVILELQSIFETEKFIGGETIFKVCEDMGISPKDALINTLLRETAQMYGVDLPTAYEEWITRKLLGARQQVQQNTGTGLKGGLSSELMDILRKVNMSSQQKESTSSRENKASSVEGISGFGRRQYEPELNTEMNFVYTGDDFRSNNSGRSSASSKKNDAKEPRNSGGAANTSRGSIEIDSSINRMAYAFGKQKKKKRKPAGNQQLSADFAGPGQDFQRFSDEEENSDEEFEKALVTEEANLEQQRNLLQSLAEANGLRPEIAAAAATAAIEQQRKTIQKKRQDRANAKTKSKAEKVKPKKGPNANLEPLGNVRAFGGGVVYADSGSSGRLKPGANNNNRVNGGVDSTSAGGSFCFQSSNQRSEASPASSGDGLRQEQRSSFVTAGSNNANNNTKNFDVGRVAQGFAATVPVDSASNTSYTRLNSLPGGVDTPDKSSTPSYLAMPTYSCTSSMPPSSAPGSSAALFSAPPQHNINIARQYQEQQQRHFSHADTSPVYQRNAPPLFRRGVPSSNRGKLPMNFSAINPNTGARQFGDDASPSGTSHLNPAFINMASQIGDDWGSLNNYLGNLLKNSKVEPKK